MRLDPSVTIECDEGVYQPSDDTYLLLSSITIAEGERVLEVGTGTGIIALHCAKSGGRVVASDLSTVALSNARRNAMANNLKVDLVRADLIAGICGRFDVIVFNPPYLSSTDSCGLKKDEKVQLLGGKAGSELSVRFLDWARGKLAENGRIYLLVSSESERDVLEHAAEVYRLALVDGKRLFFEKLSVYELRPR